MSGADGLLRHSVDGKCHNFPRAPLVLSAFYRRWRKRGRGALNGKGRGVTQRPKGPARRFRAAQSVQACAAAPACGGRPMLSLRATSVWFEGFSRWLRERVCLKLWETSVCMICLFSKLWRAFVCRRITCSRSSGAPGDVRSPYSVSGKERLQEAEDEATCKMGFRLPQGMFFRGVLQVGCVL